jgi:hypothetical protein
MSQDSEKLKVLVAFKKKLEEQIAKLDSEVTELKATLEAINSILLEKGFKRGDLKQVEASVKADASATPASQTRKEERPGSARFMDTENVIPLKTSKDELLGIIYVEKDTLHILPDESKAFSINTPPFSNFFIGKVLSKMEEKDEELVKLGELPPEKKFAYNVACEGDVIKEIKVTNVSDARLAEIRSSIRWTLEKMYEKTRG